MSSRQGSSQQTILCFIIKCKYMMFIFDEHVSEVTTTVPNNIHNTENMYIYICGNHVLRSHQQLTTENTGQLCARTLALTEYSRTKRALSNFVTSTITAHLLNTVRVGRVGWERAGNECRQNAPEYSRPNSRIDKGEGQTVR